MYNQHHNSFRDKYLDAPYSFHSSWGPAPSFYPPNCHHSASYMYNMSLAIPPNTFSSETPQNPVTQKLKALQVTPIVTDQIFFHNQVQSPPTHLPYIGQPPLFSCTPYHPSNLLNTPATTPNSLYPNTPENQCYNMAYGSPTAPKPSNQNSRDNQAQQAQYQITDQLLRCLWNTDSNPCEKLFSNSKKLGLHVREEHVEATKICQWDKCVKEFKQSYKLASHLPVHTGEKRFRCDTCAKTFGRAENLKIHKRTHTGEKPFACTHSGCDKRFGNSSDRKKHMHSHSEKRYFCEHPDCGRNYSDPSTLRNHKKTHHNDQNSKLRPLPTAIKNTASSFKEFQSDSLGKGYLTNYQLCYDYHENNF
ncbi:hypothetical protein CRE_21303 [Caenorhabditis remanei]|uniref:C2H2-type domain-containing protein n=1 Tax=Caenorhabditis remanei TaxID=31234 RepID=E3MUL1_CAERE|nr:hypothetical protein CRE_21303 [Caenorhabditis remanei]